jgi:hypothetical protein
MASKSPMGVDKSQTPLWMRVVIIAVVIAFVGGGVLVVFSGAGLGGGGSTQAGSGTGSSAIFAETYQPRVDAALVAAQSSPTNPDIVIQVGHAYYEWAVEIYQSGQVAASAPFWLSAVSYYDQVLALRPDDAVALGNKAFALYYAQSPDTPAALQAFIEGAANSTALAQQVETARGMLAEFPVQSAPSGAETTTTP